MIDLTFKTDEGAFNYRVCAVIVHENLLLAMKEDRSPYYYLPGGRVHLAETAEAAVLRELSEELDIEARIVRPLWFCQNFFTEDVSSMRFHEICLYYLIDISETDLLSRGNGFSGVENKHHPRFYWLPFEHLEEEYLYPLFIKKRIYCLPSSLEIITEIE